MRKVVNESRAAEAARAARNMARDLGAACSTLLRRAAERMAAKRKTGPVKTAASIEQMGSMSGPSPSNQLGKLSTVIDAAHRHGERAQQCHEGAGRRIDAALYELEQLRQELEAVVDPKLLKRTSEILASAATPGHGSGDAILPKADPAKAKRSAA